MAKNIKGITIELEGDATGLTKALKQVDGETKNVQNELKQVDRLLKFDPSNVELLAQKQKLLGDAVDNTSKRLDALKQAQSQVEQQFKNGEIGEDAYRKFQREIIATEGKLKAFKKQAENTKIKIEANADTSGIDKMKSALKELGPVAKQVGSEIGSALKNGAAAGSAAVGALVLGSSELNGDLARLKTNAEMAGRDLGLVEDAFKQITTVTGEADSAVETVSNLLASGFTDEQLSKVIENVNGAAIKFSDTLKTEGIADGIQETFATGAAIGPFAELLERSGVNLDKFNEGLEKAKAKGEGANYILEQMSSLGLAEVTAKYQELNPEVTKNAEATVQMQTALADLAIVLTPLITAVTDLITKFVEWATNNPTLVTTLAILSGLITGISGAIMALSPIISTIISLWPSLTAAFAAISGPIAIAIAAVVGIVAALIVAYNKFEWFRDGVQAIWNAIKDYTSVAFEAVKELIGTLISSAVDFAKGILDKFKAFWDENGKAIMTLVQLHFGTIKSYIEMIMGVIKGVFETIWPIISGVVKIAWEAIQLVIETALDLILGIIQTVMKLIQGDWEGAWETIKSTAESIVGNIIRFFEDIDLYQIGKDILQGLINGISSMGNAVLKAVTGVVSGAIDAAKELLGINSPSKVFMEFGEWTNEGFIKGIENSSQRLMNAVGNVYGSLANSAQKSTESANYSNTSSTVDNRRTFAPIVNINTTESGDRAMQRTLRRLAFQFN